ncbi:MAG: LamG domain-containing protein [Deltaproteobacteria bacterium]|nr:MAG: LamG domain-containing protein [Deltaproteobacteria bacterium]
MFRLFLRWGIVPLLIWAVLSNVGGCSGDSECKFDADCPTLNSRCVSGSCVEQEATSSEVNSPDDPPVQLECQDGHQKTCYTGSGSPQGVCRSGKQFCENNKWGPCVDEVTPKDSEECNGLDDNCDGTVDEGCDCKPGATKPCYTGPAGTEGKGLCKEGSLTCDSSGKWGACQGSVAPTTEECNNADDDCDGTVDEELTQPCYSGPQGTQDVGRCKAGQKKCVQGKWEETCSGEVKPNTEICGNNVDDDCDGTVDESSGRSLSFSGANQYVEIPHNEELNLKGSFTIELWYNSPGPGSKPLMILVNKHKYKVDDSGYHLKITQGNVCKFSWWRPNDGDEIVLGNCPTNQWTHIAFVYDKQNNKFRFYVGGSLIKEATPKAINLERNSFPLVLGTETNSASNIHFQGKMASIRISRFARYSGATISTTCVFANDNSTVGLWNLDDGGGSQVKDLSALSNDGKIVGPSWDTGRSCNAANQGEGCSPQ